MSKYLTIKRLSEYDDILTDHFIDKVYFWLTTHKSDAEYISNKTTKSAHIADLLQEHVISGPRRRPRGQMFADALEACLQLKSIQKFYKTLIPEEQADFNTHLKRYLNIWRIDAEFEITSTDRYRSSKAESCVLALRHIHRYKVLTQLSGTIVAMTEEEEEMYKADFSIIWSHRIQSMCLFLGPARFVNHDCDPNATFVMVNGNITVAAIRNIEIGEEITIAYSPDYFGPGNIDCRCASCERAGQGYFRSAVQRKEDSDGTGDKHGALQSRSASQKTGVTATIVSGSPRRFASLRGADSNGSRSSLNSAEAQRSIGIVTKNFVEDSDDDESFLEALARKTDEVHTLESTTHLPQRISRISTMQRFSSLAEDEVSHSTNEDVTSNASKDLDGPDFSRKSLRPRNAKLDYNLRKQSKESIRPVSQRRGLLTKKDPTKHYCNMCDRETLKKNMVTESIESGTRVLLCRRCRRHTKLYGTPWPERTPLPSRQLLNELENMVVNDNSDLTNAQTQTKAQTQAQRSKWQSEDGTRVSMPAMASKKPRIQPFSSPGGQMRHTKLVMSKVGIDRSTADNMGSINACAECRRCHRKCHKMKASQLRCDNCMRLDRECLFLPDARRSSQGSEHRQESSSPEPVLSIDCTYHSNKLKGSSRAFGKVNFIQTKPAFVTFVSRIDRYSNKLVNRQTQKLRGMAAQQERDKLMQLPPEARKEGMHGEFGRTSGSWYYVEVPANDDESEEPVLTESRLRSQAQNKEAAHRIDCGRRHNFLSPDTSDEEFGKMMLTAKKIMAPFRTLPPVVPRLHAPDLKAKNEKKPSKRKRDESQDNGRSLRRTGSETNSATSGVSVPGNPKRSRYGSYFYERVDSDEEERQSTPVVFDDRLSRPRSYRTGSYKE